MQKIMEMLRRIYAGRTGRGAMLRPVLLRSFWVLLLGVLAFYLLYRDSSVLSPEKKEFILAGNTEAALAAQRAMELINLLNGVLLGGVLYMGYIIWLVVCSPLFVRRFRDADLNPKIYSIFFALFALSGMLIDFSGLRALPYEEAFAQVVRSLMIEIGSIIFTLLILVAFALRPGK